MDKCKRIQKKKERAKKQGATVLERIDNLEVYARFNYHCCNCGIHTPLELKGLNLPNSPEMDHIIPLCKGGQHTHDNVQLLCRKCNIEKGESAPPEYQRIRVRKYRPKIEAPSPCVFTIEEVIERNHQINEMLNCKRKPNIIWG